MASTAPSRALTWLTPLVTLPALRLRIPDYGVLRAPHRHYCRFSHRIACIPSRAMCIVRSRGFAQSPELRLVAPFRCILLLCEHCSYPGWAHAGSWASIAPCSCSSRPHPWRFLHPWPPKRSPAVAVADPLSQHSSPAHLARTRRTRRISSPRDIQFTTSVVQSHAPMRAPPAKRHPLDPVARARASLRLAARVYRRRRHRRHHPSPNHSSPAVHLVVWLRPRVSRVAVRAAVCLAAGGG